MKGKSVIVTGGAGSMGAAETRLLVEHGAKVVFVDLVAEDGEALEAELRDSGADVRFVKADITQSKGWQDIVTRAVDDFGGVDVLVNNAGLSSMITDDVWDEEVWQRILDVNLTAPFLGIKAVVPHMVKAGGGSIVNVCSIAALIAVDAGHIAYGPSKAGIANLTKVVATRWGRDGIRVNNVYPGAFPAMRRPGARSGASEARDAVRDAVIRRTALGRLGEPGDIASAVLYFASDESSYVTGADLVVDGGVVIG